MTHEIETLDDLFEAQYQYRIMLAMQGGNPQEIWEVLNHGDTGEGLGFNEHKVKGVEENV
jgi:hypothetical protein